MPKTISILETPQLGAFSDRVSPYPFLGLVILYLIAVTSDYVGNRCTGRDEEHTTSGVVTYAMLVLAFFLWLWIQFFLIASKGKFASEITFGIWVLFVFTIVYMVDVHQPFLVSKVHPVADSAFHVFLNVLMVLMMGAAIQFAYRAKQNIFFG